jgi:hypothetical protein
MTKITSVAAPQGYDDSGYQFFKDEENQLWKAKVETKIAKPAMVAQADIEAAPAELALTVTVSPVDNLGKALREDDKPIVIDSHTHTFTSVEMVDPAFDPMARIGDILVERVELGKARLKGHEVINEFVERWNSNTKIDIVAESKPPVIEETPDNG